MRDVLIFISWLRISVCMIYSDYDLKNSKNQKNGLVRSRLSISKLLMSADFGNGGLQ